MVAVKKRRSKPVKVSTGKAASVKKTIKEKAGVNKRHIRTKEAYDLTMVEIDALMRKGEKNLNKSELSRLRSLAEAAEYYEHYHEPLPLPSSLPDMIRMRMYELRLNQSYVAKLLGVSDTKFSMIMNGRQKPDIYFIVAIHDKLNLDGNKILKAIKSR